MQCYQNEYIVSGVRVERETYSHAWKVGSKHVSEKQGQ